MQSRKAKEIHKTHGKMHANTMSKKKPIAEKMQNCIRCPLYNNVSAGRCADRFKENYGYSCHKWTLF
jgi:hypothetical protein